MTPRGLTEKNVKEKNNPKKQINRFIDRYRYELKYFVGIVSLGYYQFLSDAFAKTLHVDPHCNAKCEYSIRSLYFDTPENDDYYEKLSGISRRKKIRLRIYDVCQQNTKVEIKNKINQLVFKESATISKEDAVELIRGNNDVLLKTDNPTLNNVYYLMLKDLYRPVALVDYEREAYIVPTEDIRITFDKNIRISSVEFDLYKKGVHMYPIFNEETVVMEIKYKDFLPDWIRGILKYHTCERYAISKYCFSRTTQFK